MIKDLSMWGEKLRSAYEKTTSLLPLSFSTPKRIVWFGMGGSGVPGQILSQMCSFYKTSFSFISHPPYVPFTPQEGDFLVFCSYSGNTWETCQAFKLYSSLPFPIIRICRGGELSQEKEGLLFLVDESLTPRSALPSFLGFGCGLIQKWQSEFGKYLFENMRIAIKDYTKELSAKESFSPFFEIIKERDMLYILSIDGDAQSIAYRFQTQCNENGKLPALAATFPEICHNLIVGLGHCKERCSVVLFVTDFAPSSLRLYVKATQKLLVQQGTLWFNVPVKGKNIIEQLTYFLLWSDYASYFLSYERKVDCVEVTVIESLKKMYPVLVSSKE